MFNVVRGCIMKKLLFVALILAVALILCSCGDTITDESGNKHYLYGRFIEIEGIEYKDKYSNKIDQCIIYDRTTKVVYVREKYQYGISLSPYYVNNNGVAEIAIYGINYK